MQTEQQSQVSVGSSQTGVQPAGGGHATPTDSPAASRIASRIASRTVKRNLRTRHVSMIALGGSIGTGLFIASGETIHSAGPGGALVAYAAIGIMVYFLMTSLGEMATYLPTTGSFAIYASRFVDPALGFAMGWNYWFNWAITVAVDTTTSSIVLRYWFPQVPLWVFSLVVLSLIFLINILAVRAFGETEYWLALVKVITVLVFLTIGLLTIIGIIGGKAPLLTNFTYRKAPFVGGFPAVLGAFAIAGFSFQGTELIGITAGESANPEKSIPKAIKQVFWRILLFYILSIFVIACLIPYTSPNLLGSSASDISISPFTLVFQRAGLAAAAGVMNAVVFTSVLSAANSGMYASTRMLYALAKEKQAPGIFGMVNFHGIPVPALLGTTFVAFMAFLSSIFGEEIYTFLVAASGLTGFIAWAGIAISHYRFRRAFLRQGHRLSELRYRAKLFPFGPLLALILCILVIIGQDLHSFAVWDWRAIGITYMSVPLFLILFLAYKFKNHTKLIPLDQVDLSRSPIEDQASDQAANRAEEESLSELKSRLAADRR